VIAKLGLVFLLLTLFISSLISLLGFNIVRKKFINLENHLLQNLLKTLKILLFFLLISSLLSQLFLIYLFIISDFSVSNVYQNSHTLKPLIYKISGSWGNHEGSMLLLITILTSYTIFFAFLSKIENKSKIIIIATQSLIIAVFSAFTIFSSNPFLPIFPTPEEGLGLNPILQDIGLSMHPPMLYTGYLGFSLIYSFGIAALFKKSVDKKFAEFLSPWLFFCYGFLTLGIGLGAWWAYRELGWGGYWFWDPVENVSLMPWLIATALIHANKVLIKKNIFASWTIFLSILSFVACLIGIFLTRSGVLTSVHAFAVDASRGFFILLIIILIGGFGFLLFGVKKISATEIDKNFETKKIIFSSKISAILINNYFLLFALFIVVLATLYPLFSQTFFDQFISIGADYYNQMMAIILLPMLVFLSLSYFFNFSEKTNLKKIVTIKNIIFLIFSAILAFLIYQNSAERKIIWLVLLVLSFFASLLTIFFMLKKLDKNFKFEAKKIAKLAVFFSHLGFLFILLGILISKMLGDYQEKNIKIGENFILANYQINFLSTSEFVGKNFVAREGIFEIEEITERKDREKNSKKNQLKPQLRFYPESEKITYEADITRFFLSDLYLVLGQKDEQDFFAIRAYYKPMINLIWLGCLLIFTASLIKILPRKNSNL
jgi:cytochrome c-type biogenesis protein CcmF